MARRASSGLNPGIILAAVVVIGGLIYGGSLLFKEKPASFGDAPALRIDDLLENGNSLRSNVYIVDGEVDEKLQFSNRGQLVSVKVSGSRGDEFIGIEIPTKFNHLNIDTKQKYSFRVEFKQGGIAVATGINRL